MNMKSVSPYLYFNGNCTDAITLYEKAFDVKAEAWLNEEVDNFVEHAHFEIGASCICLCDTESPVKAGDNMMLAIEFDAEDEHELMMAKVAFGILKENGEVIMELEENSWNKCFGILTDKFGVKWQMCGGMK